MKNLNIKKLVENRLILFFPTTYIYLSILMFAMTSLDLTPQEWQAIIFFSFIPVAVSQGKTTYDSYSLKNVDQAIFKLSWVLTILAVCLMGLFYYTKGSR